MIDQLIWSLSYHSIALGYIWRSNIENARLYRIKWIIYSMRAINNLFNNNAIVACCKYLHTKSAKMCNTCESWRRLLIAYLFYDFILSFALCISLFASFCYLMPILLLLKYLKIWTAARLYENDRMCIYIYSWPSMCIS